MQNDELPTPLNGMGEPISHDAMRLFAHSGGQLDNLIRWTGNTANLLPTMPEQDADAVFAHMAAMPLNMLAAAAMHRAAVAGEDIPTIEQLHEIARTHINYALKQSIPYLRNSMMRSIEAGEHLKGLRPSEGDTLN